MGSLTRRLVTSLPEVSSGQASWTNSDIAYDYAIGGLPFLSAANSERPLIRRTGPYRKEQIDTSSSPGEQSLLNWWLRSQSSFHAGTGIIFEEPDTADPTVQLRFADSAGVNVWTPGKVTLLKQANAVTSASGVCLLTAGNDGTNDCWLQSDDTALKRVTPAGTTTAVTWGGANTILSLANDGINYYAADSVGIYVGTLAGGAGTKVWNTGDSHVVAAWVKQRLVAGIGNKLYELADTSGAPTLPTAKYTHPVTSWQWTALTEGPAAIYAAGYAGTQSAIYKLVLDTSGSVPTLTSAIATTQLPIGEYVTALGNYLGDYLVIGTNRGVRVALIDPDTGNLQLGALSVDFSKMSGTPGPVYSFAGRDRFVFFTLTNGISSLSGLGCLDLSTTVSLRRYAYATDLQSHVAGTSRGVGIVGTANRLVFTVDGHGSYLESAADLEPFGFLKTGNIRFHTVEPKLFKYALTRAAPLTDGSIAVECIDPTGVATTMATYSTGGGDITDEATFPTALGPQEYVSLRFTLTRGSTTTLGPEFRSYQIKALPGAKRQRLFSLKLLCFDEERDRSGSLVGNEGSAISRLEELESLEEVGDLVLLQDLTQHPSASRLGVIDELEFVQTAPPKNNAGWGGIITAVFRAVT